MGRMHTMTQAYKMGSLFGAPGVADDFALTESIVLHHGDTAEFTKTIPSESIQLIITSPPYNIGKQYEVRQAIESYLDQQSAVIDDLVRVLSPHGSVCWQVGNYVENSEVFPLTSSSTTSSSSGDSGYGTASYGTFSTVYTL